MKFLSLIFTVLSLLTITTFATPQPIDTTQLTTKLAELEKSFDGKIGVYAINTNNKQVFAYHADDRFPMQSTLKWVTVTDLLDQAKQHPSLLQEKIQITKTDLMFWAPITGKYVGRSMTLAALAEAAITYSDNVAANLIIKKLGGPQAITEFAHATGNTIFNVKHYEGDLNSDPTNPDDTATPKGMALSLQQFMLGDVLKPVYRMQLFTWMTNNKAGYKRMRAGTPLGWSVADKTGTGDYGIANDIGLLSSPVCKPVVLAIYTIRKQKDAAVRDDIVASTTQLVMAQFAQNTPCFNKLFT